MAASAVKRALCQRPPASTNPASLPRPLHRSPPFNGNVPAKPGRSHRSGPRNPRIIRKKDRRIEPPNEDRGRMGATNAGRNFRAETVRVTYDSCNSWARIGIDRDKAKPRAQPRRICFLARILNARSGSAHFSPGKNQPPRRTEQERCGLALLRQVAPQISWFFHG